MKNRIKILGIAFMLIIGLGACEKAYLEPETRQTKAKSLTEDFKDGEAKEAPKDMITQGGWMITTFQWHNIENKDHFKGYVFYFLPDGTVEAVHNNVKDIGKWDLKDTSFRLNFGITRPLVELSTGWYFTREGNRKFMLKGMSPLDSNSQYVEFERL